MTEILFKIVNDWWDTAGMEFRTFLSDLSGDNCFHEDLPVSDRLNVYLYAKINEIHFDKRRKDAKFRKKTYLCFCKFKHSL